VCSCDNRVRRYHGSRQNTYSNIKNVEADTTHILLSADTLFRGPLEGGNTRVLDFVEVLNTLRGINEQIGASGFGTETPDLPCVSDIPTEFISEDASPSLVIVTGVDGTGLDSLGELLIKRQGLGVETVVLVLGLGQCHNRGLSLDSLTVTDDRVGDLERNTGVVFLEILE
jgi:hypothetical protein